ncbi:hypothetical protein DM02DRAFT_696871 [Periconia macrospinosa]|uniref:Ubiquitin-like protease family profile domain-containing protein n=1 Tax=Periconia macrospinosa TaxID=97972 RepID=A0A2V1DYZ9_9PLEO|nr:hypothetical protein DM02DRAFT_696871 [Periconia macrospinosa]
MIHCASLIARMSCVLFMHVNLIHIPLSFKMPPKRKAKKRAANDRNDNRPKKAAKTANNSSPKHDVSWVIPPEESRSKPPYPFNEAAALGFAPELFGEEYGNLRNRRENASLKYKPSLGSPVRSATDGKPNPRFKQCPKSPEYERLYREIQNATGNPFDLGAYAFHQFVRAWAEAQEKQGAVIVYPGTGPFVATETADISATGSEAGAKTTFRFFRATHSQTVNKGFFIRLEPGNSITVNDDEWTCTNAEGAVTIGPLTPYTAIETQSQPIFFWNTGDALFGKAKGNINITYSKESRGLDATNPNDGPIKWRAASDAENVNSSSASNCARSIPETIQTDTADTPAGESTSIGLAQQTTEPLVSVDTQIPEVDDSCTYFGRILQLDRLLRFHTDLQTKPIDEPLAYKDIFNAVASVTQAVSSIHTDAKEYNQCFAHIDFETVDQASRDGNLTTKFQMLYPSRPLVLPWRTNEDHTFLVVVQRTRDAISLTVLDTAPWFSGSNARQTTLERLHTLLKHSRYSPNKKELEELRRGPITWITPFPTDEKWKAECFTILHAWAFALGLDLNPSFPAHGLHISFYQDFRKLLAIALHGLADWTLIWAFLHCKGMIIDSESKIAQGDRITNTISSEDVDKNLLGLIEKAGRESRVSRWSIRSVGFPREYRQIYPGDFITDWWTGEDMKAWPGRLKKDSQAKDRFTEKEVPPELETPSPCEELREKLNAKLSQEDIKVDLKKLEKEEHIANKYEYLHDLEVSNAILCVIMPINTRSVTDGRFNFIVSDDVQKLRASGEFLHGFARRNGQPLFYAWTDKWHHVLHIIQYKDGKPTVSILDSMRTWDHDYRKRMHRGAIKIMKEAWLVDQNSTLPQSSHYIACAEQNGLWSCGFHTILNGWALALGLNLNPKFKRPKSDWEKGSDKPAKFLDDLYHVVRLAQIGQADWSLITAFLRCYEYVQPGGEVPESRQFEQTNRIVAMRDWVNYSEEMGMSDAIYESLRASDPTLPEILEGRVEFPGNGRINRHNFYLAGDTVSDQNILLGIASVVEAIDLFQKNDFLTRSEGTPFIPRPGENELRVFSGGFALASFISARPEKRTSQFPSGRLVTRPRRCWLLPMKQQDSQNEVQNYLVILQEEHRGKEMLFKSYVANSSAVQSDLTKATSRTALETVKKLADRLGWSTHRNLEGFIKFDEKMTVLPVAKHSTSSESAARTIINAWIYALGLRPNPGRNSLGLHDLEECYAIIDEAMLGDLSWKDIFDFLKGSNHILDTSPDAVPANRRFMNTANEWKTGIKGLDERLHGSQGQYEVDDAPLAEIEYEDYTYDLGNNLTPAQLNQPRPNGDRGLRREMEITDELDENSLPDYQIVKIDFELDKARRERQDNLRFLDKW